jgi:GDP-L-fucose synthase
MPAADAAYLGRRALVAGGTGTIGIPLVRQLLERGAEVTVVSLHDEAYARAMLGPDIRFRRADLTDLDECLRATQGQEFVFNLVGIKGSVGIGETKVASYFVPMLRFQTNLMDAAFRSGASRFLFVSSVCAYPPSPLHHEDNVWNGLPKQNDRYPGLAKRIGEAQGETYLKEFGWDAVRIVRPANVYGPHDDFDPRTAQVIPALISRMVAGENPVRVWGDGSAIRDFVFSEDVAYWCLEAAARAPACTPINLGAGQGRTIREVATVIARLVPGRPEIAWDPDKPTGDPVRLLSVERARKLLGYSERTPLEKGIRATIEWYLRQPAAAQSRKEAAS